MKRKATVSQEICAQKYANLVKLITWTEHSEAGRHPRKRKSSTLQRLAKERQKETPGRLRQGAGKSLCTNLELVTAEQIPTTPKSVNVSPARRGKMHVLRRGRKMLQSATTWDCGQGRTFRKAAKIAKSSLKKDQEVHATDHLNPRGKRDINVSRS